MRPSRRPPHWVAFPRPLQARIAQLLTGRAVLQPFLHLINPDEYDPPCPFGDGIGTLGHYIEQCQATSTWRVYVRKDLGDDEPLPSWQELLSLHPHYLFALIDHSALGSQSFAKKTGPRRIRPLRSFWKPPRKPIQAHRWTFIPMPHPQPGSPWLGVVPSLRGLLRRSRLSLTRTLLGTAICHL